MSLSRFIHENKRALVVGGAIVAAVGVTALLLSSRTPQPVAEDHDEDHASPVTVTPGSATTGSANSGASSQAASRRNSGSVAAQAPPSAAAAATAAAPATSTAVAAAGAGGKITAEEATLSKDSLLQLLRTMARRLKEFKEEMEPRAAGISDEEGFMRYQMEVTEGLRRIEEEVQSEYRVDQRGMMASQAAHREDPSIRGALEEVRRVFMGDEEMPDPDAITLPEGMTPDKFMDLFTRHLGVIESKFEAAVADAERRASDPEQRKDYLMLLLQRGMAAWQAEAFEEVGVDQETFQACLFKFQTDPELGTKLAERVAQSQKRQSELMNRLES